MKLFLSNFFLPETEYMELELRSVEVQGAHEIGGRALQGGAPLSRGPLRLHPPQLQLHIFMFGEKKSERRIHRVLQYKATAKP